MLLCCNIRDDIPNKEVNVRSMTCDDNYSKNRKNTKEEPEGRNLSNLSITVNKKPCNRLNSNNTNQGDTKKLKTSSERKRAKENKEKKESKDIKESKNNTENKVVKDNKESKDNKENKINKDSNTLDKSSASNNTKKISNDNDVSANQTVSNNNELCAKDSNNVNKQTTSKLDASAVNLSFGEFDVNPYEESNKVGSKLLLTGEVFFNKEIIINTQGMKNGARKKKNDLTYFGLKNSKDYTGTYYNDFIINFPANLKDDANYSNIETSTGRVFEICYRKRTKEYVLYFIHNSLILYYKINNFVYFEPDKEYYMILGNVFVTLNVRKLTPNEKGINIQVEIENEKPKRYSFKQSQCPIKIGRINSDITIQKPSISKAHSIIEYSKNNSMFFYKDLGSTNGSTLLIREDDNIKLKGEMHFKLEDIPFKIQEIP